MNAELVRYRKARSSYGRPRAGHRPTRQSVRSASQDLAARVAG